MNAKQIAIEFLKTVEGCRLKVYLDTGGVKTIGYGHTGPYLPDEITMDEAIVFLEDDLNKVFDKIVPLIKIEVSPNQLAACLSFAFNVGSTAFRNSTLLKRLNNSDFKGVVAEFSRWVYDNHIYCEGIKNRRNKEIELFNGKDPFFSASKIPD